MTYEDIKVQLIPFPAFSWESQRAQYATLGLPGVQLEYHWVDLDSGEEVFPANAETGPDLPGATRIDCLLHRGTDGLLNGILNHYDGRNPLERRDSINVWVKTDCQRQGIATALVLSALDRWPGITYDKQRYTRDGIGLVKSLIRKEGL